MKKGWAVLFSVLAVFSLLMGCAGQAGQQAKPAQESAKEGGTVVLGTIYQPATLNPIMAPDVVSKAYIDTLFDGLMAVNDQLEMVPRLAETYQSSPDGLTWTFNLRKGVKFHDGQELTSDDVKFTYDTVIKDKNAKLAKTDYANVTAIDTPDKYTVKFTLSEKNASFLSKLAVGIVPKHVLQGQDLTTTEFNRKPVGTGPFMLEEWAPAQKVSIKANPDYFRGKPKLDHVIWKILADSNVLNVQLLKGEIDGAGVDPEIEDQLRKTGKYAFYDLLSANTYIGFQNENPLFQDKRVRQALNYGLNKQEIIDKILLGAGIQSTSNLMPNSWAYNPNVNKYPYDKEKAKKLLADAGWKPGSDGVLTKDGQRFKFVLLTNTGSKQRESIILYARQQWAELGIEVEPQFMELNAFINERVLTSKFDAIFLAGSVNVDPDYLNRSHNSRSIQTGHNFLRYSNPDLDKILDQAVTTLDQNARKQLYFKAQEIIADDSPMVPIYYPKGYTAIRSDLQGVKPNPYNLYWNINEWHY